MKEAKNTEPISSNGVQHELGKELSVILACCFLLRSTLQDELSEEELRQLRKIERSAEKIRDLTAALLKSVSPTGTDRLPRPSSGEEQKSRPRRADPRALPTPRQT